MIQFCSFLLALSAGTSVTLNTVERQPLRFLLTEAIESKCEDVLGLTFNEWMDGEGLDDVVNLLRNDANQLQRYRDNCPGLSPIELMIIIKHGSVEDMEVLMDLECLQQVHPLHWDMFPASELYKLPWLDLPIAYHKRASLTPDVLQWLLHKHIEKHGIIHEQIDLIPLITGNCLKNWSKSPFKAAKYAWEAITPSLFVQFCQSENTEKMIQLVEVVGTPLWVNFLDIFYRLLVLFRSRNHLPLELDGTIVSAFNASQNRLFGLLRKIYQTFDERKRRQYLPIVVWVSEVHGSLVNTFWAFKPTKTVYLCDLVEQLQNMEMDDHSAVDGGFEVRFKRRRFWGVIEMALGERDENLARFLDGHLSTIIDGSNKLPMRVTGVSNRLKWEELDSLYKMATKMNAESLLKSIKAHCGELPQTMDRFDEIEVRQDRYYGAICSTQ